MFLPLGVCLPVAAQNLLTNGNFETGTVSGFTTALSQVTPGALSNSSYDIRTTAAAAGTSWGPSADHTTGSGQYMFITRGANGNNTVTAVWSATVSSTTATRYTFSGYAAIPTSTTANQTPSIRLVVTGTGFTQTFNFAKPSTAWGLFEAGFQYTGSSGTVTYTLSIVNGSSGLGQPDAISWDDFLISAPEPSTYAAGVALAGIVAWQWRAARRRRNTANRG